MRTDVQSRGFSLTPALQSTVRQEALGFERQFPRGVSGVSVRLFDVNGPRGGPDKGCMVHARVGRGGSTVVASHVDADLYRAISGAFAKFEAAARAAMKRALALRRRVRPRDAGAPPAD
jgi:ribosome-associated translation inhibitor RaiA